LNVKTPDPLQHIWDLIPNKLSTFQRDFPVLSTCKPINDIVHTSIKNCTVHLTGEPRLLRLPLNTIIYFYLFKQNEQTYKQSKSI